MDTAADQPTKDKNGKVEPWLMFHDADVVTKKSNKKINFHFSFIYVVCPDSFTCA